MANKITARVSLDKVVRYVDVNHHVPRKLWNCETGREQRMYCFWFTGDDGQTFQTFTKRSNSGGICNWFREWQDSQGGRVDGKEITVGVKMDLTGNVKCVKPEDQHGPARTVVTHVKVNAIPEGWDSIGG